MKWMRDAFVFASLAFLFWVATYAQDLLFLIGFAAIVFGFSMAWLPLGFIVGGLIVCGLLVVRRLRSQGGRDAAT